MDINVCSMCQTAQVQYNICSALFVTFNMKSSRTLLIICQEAFFQSIPFKAVAINCIKFLCQLSITLLTFSSCQACVNRQFAKKRQFACPICGSIVKSTTLSERSLEELEVLKDVKVRRRIKEMHVSLLHVINSFALDITNAKKILKRFWSIMTTKRKSKI